MITYYYELTPMCQEGLTRVLLQCWSALFDMHIVCHYYLHK